MANARHFVKAEYFDKTENLLAYHRGQFRVWNGTSWPILDEADLRTRVGRFFEHAVYVAKTTDGPVEKAFKPTKG
jgi:hypothetical protein